MSLLLLDDYAFLDSGIPQTADFAVELGLGVNPWSDAEVWTDITTYVIGMPTCTEGRRRYLDRPAVGKMTLVLKNDDRRFDPTYTAGPYYGNLRVNTPVRFRVSNASDHAFLFQGFVDGWPTDFKGRVGKSTVTASTSFKLLAKAELGTSLFDTLARRDGASHRWRLADSGTVAVDDFGGVDLTIQNSPTTGATGIVAGSPDSAISWPEGTAGREVVEGRSPQGFLVPPCTFEIMVQIADADPAHEHNIMGLWKIDGGPTFKLRLSNSLEPLNPVVLGSISIDMQNSRTVMGTSVVADGLPHHLAVTFSADHKVGLFIDGVDETRLKGSAPTSATSPWATTDSILALGNYALRSSGDVGFDDGTLAYATIYPSVLTAAQIAEHADAAVTGGEGDTSGGRLERVLDAIGFPASKRAIDDGSTIVTVDGYGGSAFEYAQLLAQTERGQLYIDGEGKVTFRGRANILTDTRSATSQATFSDDGADPTYVEFEPTYDELQVRNPVSITRTGGSTMTVQDVDAYNELGGPTDYAETGLLYTDDFESLSVAQHILANDKTPRRRVEKITIQPQGPTTDAGADELWGHVMNRTIGDRITVEDTPLGIGTQNSADIIIEGVEHKMTGKKWQTSYYGSPANTQPFWLLGVAGFSELGETTYLAF